MNGQHIPGFYYDQDKNKYFKIQSQSAARDLNLKYSTSNLAKQRRREHVQRAATAKKDRTQKERVVRRHASSFIQTDLDREIGFKRQSVYLHNIWPEACMSAVSASPEPVTSSDDHGVIRFFDRDPVSKTIYAVCGETRIMRRHHLGNVQSLDTNSRYAYHPWDDIGRTTSTVSSLHYMPNSGALALTTIGSDRPPIVQLSDPDRDGPHISQQFTPKACAAIFCAAPRPRSFTFPHHPRSIAATQTDQLAVGAQQALLAFTRSPSGSWDSSTLIPDLAADILALDWLSPSTIAAGCRNGKIHVHDLRSAATSHVLTHPYPVSKLVRADDATRLLCSGLQDTLFLYDMRMPRLSAGKGIPNTQGHHYNDTGYHKRKRRLNRKPWAASSQPVLSFAHTNQDDLDLHVAVHARLGLVAASQDLANCHKAIAVSNMWTGKTLREFASPRTRGQNVRGLKWVDDHDSGGVSLWATWRGDIAAFAW